MTCPSEASTALQIDIAILGGAFDPCHIGHEMVAMVVHAHTGYKFWFMPCYNHKFGKEMVSPGHRFNMCDRVTEGLGEWALTSSFEIERKHNGSTYELLVALKKQHPNHKFHLVMGTDNYNDVRTKWHRGVELIAENPVIVIGRAGHPLRDDLANQPNKLYIDFHFACSATDVRSYIEHRKYEESSRFLRPQVKNYISDLGLYGWEKE